MMRKVPLERLRDAFVQAIVEALGPAAKYLQGAYDFATVSAKADFYADNYVEASKRDQSSSCDDLLQSAMLYVIARDQGLDAAVMWKLSRP